MIVEICKSVKCLEGKLGETVLKTCGHDDLVFIEPQDIIKLFDSRWSVLWRKSPDNSASVL